MEISGHYDWKLVAVSILVAICASYAAFELAGRTAIARPRGRFYWLAGGSTSLGFGIWSMHYIGMLSYRMSMPVLYDVPTVGLSLLASNIASWIAISIVSRSDLRSAALIKGSVAVGVGIAVMHYTGMNAMRMAATAIYRPAIFAFSIAVALIVSLAGLSLAFRFRDCDSNSLPSRLASACVMGLAISGMHYCGMAAVRFEHGPVAPDTRYAVNVSTLGTVAITSVTFVVLGLTLACAFADRHFALQKRMLRSEQDRWQLVIHANQDGLFDSDLTSGRLYFSPRWKEMLGYAADQLADTADSWIANLHPEDRQRVQASLNAYLEGREGVYKTEYRMRHRDGSWRWIRASAVASWNERGEPVRLVGSHSDITEQKHALDELKASEARFSAFMQYSPYIAFMRDSDDRITYCSRTLEAGFQAQLEQALALHKETEFVFTVPGGESQRHFLTKTFSFAEASGRMVSGGVAMDITERVESEEKVRASGRRYRELFERNPVPCWTYCVKSFKILEVNEAAVEHYGWPRQQFVGLPLDCIQDKDDTDAIEAPEAGNTIAGPARRVKHRRQGRPDIWVEIASHVVEIASAPARLVMANDVTARFAAEDEVRRAQEQLKNLVSQRTSELGASEAKWRNLVEALPQFVWTTGPDGQCDYLSNQWQEYTGCAVCSPRGLDWLSCLHPADRARIMARWKSAFQALERFETEARVRGKDGSYRWFVVHARPIRESESGHSTRWLGTCTDIDDQKRSEERLETAVLERTVALEEARDRAESAAKAKSSFLAAMSHEIRTPMNGVIGMTSLMAHTALNSQQRSYLDTIRSSGVALLNIINDVLDFSKIDAGKMELESLTFDLQTLLEESTELIRVAAAPKGLDVLLHVDDAVPFTVIGDPGRLRQIVLNLLSNAVKFTETGSVALTLSCERHQDQQAYLRFSVRDTGIGMTQTEQAGLFQAFTQADRSTTRRFGGTGLGLSIAKRLVELMGGEIGVFSTSGNGSTFWFNLCLSTAQVVDTEFLSGRRMILVDDNLNTRIATATYLKRAGVHVSDAGETKEAADLMIVDAAMLAGESNLEAFRNSAVSAGCPILVLGAPADWKGSTASNLSVAEYLPKPVRCVALLEAVYAILNPSEVAGRKRQFRVEDGPSAGAIEIHGAKILVVEDNKTNQVIAEALLKRLGCRTELAHNGREACTMTQRAGYDLILMDCQMPEMDGFEATRVIRSRNYGESRTPIIALTAGVLTEEREECFEAGMDDFLSKPISIEQLKTTLQKWLALRPLIEEQQTA